MAATYQTVRDNLISLTVELDDKSKLSETLLARIQIERERLETVELKVEQDVAPQLENEKKRHKEETEKLLAATNELVAKKRSLLSKCESLVSEISSAEEEVAAAVKRTYEEGQKKVDAGRRQFKSGAEDRQKKQLAAKYAELLESTRTAMEPEFSRLRLAHQRDVTEAESLAMDRERSELAEIEKQHQSRIAAEEKRLREEYRSRSRLQLDAAISSIERLEREHKQKIEKLRQDLHAEHQQYCLTQEQQQLSRFDEGAQVSVAEESLQQRLASLRRQHASEISALEKDHTAKYMQQRKKDIKKDEIAGEELSSDHREQLKRYEAEVRAEHEAALKRTISQLQAEVVLEQRQIKEQSQLRKKEMSDLSNREVSALWRRRESIDEDVSALGIQREELSAQLRQQTMELHELQESLAQHRQRSAMKRNELLQLQHQASSLREKYENDKSDMVSRHSERMHELQALYENVRSQREEQMRNTDAALSDIEAAHENRLDSMNQQARSDISKRDADMDILRDAIQTEKVKLQRLKKVLARYS